MLKLLERGLLACLFVMLAFAVKAQTTVSGTVTDNNGSTLAGVEVTAGTRALATSGADGSYSINVPTGVRAVTFKLNGYQTTTLTVNGATLNASLKVLNKDLNEVVVVGYGTRKKGDLTASMTTITTKDFQKGAITTPDQLIAGKVAGVQITSNSGAPGAGSTIRIRGGASLNASNDPLIVIDDVPVANNGIAGAPNALALINPNDIESFVVLKDAAATAIYGSRASNGVILITTKKGKRNSAPVANFSTMLSFGTVARLPEVLSADEFRNYINANGNTTQKGFLGGANTNWFNEVYRTAITSDNNFSVSGSAGKMPYRFSIGYLSQDGLLITDNLKRASIGLNLSPRFLNDNLRTDLNIKLSNTNTNYADRGAIGGAAAMDPTQAVKSGSARFGGYTEILDPNNALTGLRAFAPRNPVGLINQRSDEGTSNRVIANLKLDYRFPFFKDIRTVLNVGTDRSNGNGRIIVSDSSASSYRRFLSGTNYFGGVNTQYRQENANDLLEFFVNYNKDIAAIKSKLELNAGYTYQQFTYTNFNNPDLTRNGTVVTSPVFPKNIDKNVLISYVGRANLNIMNKYLITASLRRDGSSRFSELNRWGLFPSASIAWKLKEESFLKNVTAVNDLKIRLGYGVTGQQEIGNYDYQSFIAFGGNQSQYQLGNTFFSVALPSAFDALRKWEQSTTYNAGIDFSLFNNRIGGSVDVYLKKTEDLLAPVNQPAGTNFGFIVTQNVGDMENRGVELNLNGVAVQKKNLTVEANFNLTYNTNEITKLNRFDNPAFKGFEVGGISGGTGNTIQIHSVGNPQGSFYTYKQVYDAATGKPIEDVFYDYNRDGNVNDDDRVIDKSPNPDWLIGFSPNVTYKKWNMGMVFRANIGNHVYNNFASNTGVSRHFLNPLNYLANGSRSILSSGFTGSGSRYFRSDYYIENASFLRMDNLSVGYDAGKLINGWDGNFRIMAAVQNVFVATKYTGVDPELNGGIDNNIYPRPRTFTVGVTVDFGLKK
jgi:TonB-dependent starch-binding outer membrane protein SusC